MKIANILVLSVSVAALAACGKSQPDTATPADATPEAAEEMTDDEMEEPADEEMMDEEAAEEMEEEADEEMDEEAAE